jgi:hypothetical protein
MDITFLIILLLAVAFLLRIDFIFYILYIVVALYAWSRWYPGWALKQLISAASTTTTPFGAKQFR